MSILSNALSGAQAAQVALATASQNVANVMTPGYTRQGVAMTSIAPSRTGAQFAGDGVRVPALIRFSDSYKSLQMWQANSELGHRSAGQPYLTQLEQVMGNEASGIGGGIDAFFAALNAASVEPTSGPLRQQIISAAEAMAQRFNSMQQVLSNQRSAINQQRTSGAAQASALSTDIAALNSKIAAMRASGGNSSALTDARDGKIDELAGLMAIQVIDQPDGSRNVSLRGGQPLVVGAAASSVGIVLVSGEPIVEIRFASQTFTASGAALGGQLGGLDDLQHKVLEPIVQSISEMASQVTTQVNTALAAGFDLDGLAGAPLFVFDPATGRLSTTPGLKAAKLGFSSDATKPGNSDVLLDIVKQQNQPITVTSLGAVLLGDAYSQLVGRLATDSQQNQAALGTGQTVRDQSIENWKSTSGVNQDEEAVNLMQYQQMYQANMKVIAVANDLFDATLAMFR